MLHATWLPCCPLRATLQSLRRHRRSLSLLGSYMAACGPSGYAESSDSLRKLIKEAVVPLLQRCVAAHAGQDGAACCLLEAARRRGRKLQAA